MILEFFRTLDVFGGTPKTASETLALPPNQDIT